MALDEFMKAVRFDPKNASAHKNIGVIYFTKGGQTKGKRTPFPNAEIRPELFEGCGYLRNRFTTRFNKKE